MNRGAEHAWTADPVLRGTFDTTPLADVFAVLALSRQLVALRLSDEGGDVGAIAVKAGQVVGAEDFRTRTTGNRALKNLVNHPGTTFSVDVLPRDGAAMQAVAVIGKLEDLLPEAGAKRESDSLPPPSPSAGPSRADDVIMHGDISDAGFDEILEVLPLSQQHLLVSFIRGDSVVGEVNLMSGQVLAATAGSLQGIEAFNRLYADHGESFQVRRLPVPDVSGGLGDIAALRADARRKHRPSATYTRKPQQGERSMFMQGTFADFPLEVLIDSLAFCRQTIELVFCARDRVLHRAIAKSGRIAAVASIRGKGVDAAMAAIREDPGVLFRVYRRSDSVARQSVASLRELVSEAGAAPESSRDLSAPSFGPDDRAVGSAARGATAQEDELSAVAARLKQLVTDVAELRATLETPRQDPTRTELAEALTRFAAREAKLRSDSEQSFTSAIHRLRKALGTHGPGRHERVLLWCIFAAQLGVLAVLASMAMLMT